MFRKLRTRRFLIESELEHLPKHMLPHQASDRRYWRIARETDSVIFCDAPGLSRAQVQRFTQLNRTLIQLGAKVPAIIKAHRALGLYLLEDLGNTTLMLSTNLRGDLYLALDLLCQLQSYNVQQIETLKALPRLDETYLKKRLVLNRARMRQFMPKDGTDIIDSFAGTKQERLFAHLRLDDSKCLVHSDFQSTNLMIDKGTCYFIDYQDAKIGSCLHDLSSLLEDPQLDLTASTRSDILIYYSKRSPTYRLEPFETLSRNYQYRAILKVYDLIGTYLYLGRAGVLKYRRYAAMLLPRFRELSKEVSL